ncbi:MAG: YiiD C-terminal domain-containing protein [Ignavibacteria bacterium]|nr:YiiD C-terminal domain-containing protein [Ignavibacteria bacterium]
MNVCDLPFNKFVGLEPYDNPEYLLMLKNKKEYLNHLETVHASAQFALAEATSGHFLLNEFRELTGIIPVVRKTETKFKKPAYGCVYSKASFAGTDKTKIIEELNTRHRALITVRVELFDSGKNFVMQSDFEWFIVQK